MAVPDGFAQLSAPLQTSTIASSADESAGFGAVTTVAQNPWFIGGLFEDDGDDGESDLLDSVGTNVVGGISNVESKTTSLMVDTGACRTAVERSAFAAPLEQSEVKGLRTVMHEPVKVYGEQHPSMVSRRSGRAMTTRALVTDIKRNVLSVGEGADQGNWYVFGPGGARFMTRVPLPIPPDEYREDFRRARRQDPLQTVIW